MVNPTILQAFGLELEYAIVDQVSLNVIPRADFLLEVQGNTVSELARGVLAWSNELVKHVIEIKNPSPVRNVSDISLSYIAEVEEINARLGSIGCMLLPTGAHPWMNSETERVLWEQEQTEIYQAYDRIFSTKGHGWANLQSSHLNISFSGSKEFGNLQRILRPLLPLIPGLCATTPFFDGSFSGYMDGRMKAYSQNQKSIPSIAGRIIPEPVFSIPAYEKEILANMYKDIQPQDPQGLLQEDWLNSRGAIPKFSRSSMEIRIIDLQAHPAYDLLIAQLLIDLLKHIYKAMEKDSKLKTVLETLSQDTLVQLYESAIQLGSIADASFYRELHREFPQLFPFDPKSWDGSTMRHFWSPLLQGFLLQPDVEPKLFKNGQDFLAQFISGGTWAEQTVQALGINPTKNQLKQWYETFALQLPGAKNW